MIAPATVEGLGATRHGYSGLAGWPTLLLGVISTFLVALLLQMYTLFGSQTLERLNEKNDEAKEVYTQINTVEQHKPELYQLGLALDKRTKALPSGTIGDTPVEPKPAQPDWQTSTPEYTHLRARLDAINDAKAEVFENIYQWNAVWGAPVARFLHGREPGEYWGFECNAEDFCKAWMSKVHDALIMQEDTFQLWDAAPFGHIQILYGSEALARSNLETLRGLVLPVLYGALGAWVWLLRERYSQVRSRRLRSPVWGEYLQRVLLGAVFGAALGYLNLPSFLPDAVANISLIGLAFVIGYNVEVMFWLFDQMFSAMREKSAKEERKRARILEQAAGAGRTPPPAGAPA